MSIPDQMMYHVRLATGEQFGPASTMLLMQWAREGRVPRDAAIVGADGSAIPAPSHPALAVILNAPPTVAAPLPPEQPDGGISTLIPFRNGAALAGYYVSVFSLIPIFGLILGPIAVVLGVMGFRAASKNPGAKGTAHAIVAIVLGSLVVCGHVAILIVWMIRP